MIFLGDFVYPFEDGRNILNFDDNFLREPKMLNLEGLILNPAEYKKATPEVAVYSTPSIYEYMKKLNIKSVGLANNHIRDFDFDIELLKRQLEDEGIRACGAGKSLDEALAPVLLEDDENSYVIYSFGWNVIGCKYATGNSSGVAPLDEDIILECVKDAKAQYPERKIVMFLHWNIEFEYYPQPADRQLAFLLIDAGADIIIGHHPHIVGVFESYKNKPIFYSLGNFLLPDYNYNGFDLHSSERAKTGLGIKYSDKMDDIALYWIKSVDNVLEIEDIEHIGGEHRLEDISTLYQNDLGAYAKWFKVNRRKNKLLPIYKSHKNTVKNRLLYKIMKIRNLLVYHLTNSGLRKRNS